MTTLLVVDASSTLCSVALTHQQQTWHLVEEQPRRQAQLLLPMVAEVLQRAQISKSELQGIAYGRGPGSFTGIRIAASVTQGLALALSLPVYGISSLQALAQAAFVQTSATQVMAIMNAHMGEIFWASFVREAELSRALSVERVGAPEFCAQDIKSFSGLLAGDGLAFLPEQDQSWAGLQPLAEMMLPLALDAWHKNLFSQADQHLPVYLREGVAWKKLDEQPSLLRR